MKEEWLVKALALSIILLFISVSFQPATAKDTSTKNKSYTKELFFETILEIENDKQIQDIIQKSEIKGSPLKLRQFLDGLEKEIIEDILRNEELNKRLKQSSDLSCGCENNFITNRDFPGICRILNNTAIWISLSYMFLGKYVYQWLIDHNRTLVAKTLAIFIYSITYFLIPVIFLQLIFNCIEIPSPS